MTLTRFDDVRNGEHRLDDDEDNYPLNDSQTRRFHLLLLVGRSRVY